MTAQATTYPVETPLTPWWLVLIEGIAAIILGIFLLISPATTIFVVVQFLGFYWLITGIFSIISIFVSRAMWGWKLFSGALGILAGLLIIQNPLWSSLLVPATLVIVMGVFGLVIGVLDLIKAFGGGGWGIGVLGVLSILFGLLLLGQPLLATLSLPLFLGIAGIVFGVLALFGAFRIKRVEDDQRAASKLGAATAAQTEGSVWHEPEVMPVTAGGPGPVVEAVGTVGEGAATAAAVAGATAFAAAETAGQEAVEPAAEMPGAAEPTPGEPAAEVVEITEATVETVELTDGSTAEAVTEDVVFVSTDETGTVDKVVEVVTTEVTVREPSEKSADAEFMDLDENAKFGYDLEYVEGIGPAYAEKFRAVGVSTIHDFFEKGASAAGRAELAEMTGVSQRLILEWINHVDLYRIKGVGSEYADLLEEAGVDTVVELATRNPANLFGKLVAVNVEKKLVRRVPVQSQVEDWVNQAKTLPRRVSY